MLLRTLNVISQTDKLINSSTLSQSPFYNCTLAHYYNMNFQGKCF